MWIIIRTLKGKNSFLTESGQWSQDRNEAERFDQFDYAVYYRDKEIAPRERRGVGVVKFSWLLSSVPTSFHEFVGPHGESALTRVPAHALSVPRTLHISDIHDYDPSSSNCRAGLGTCSLLEPIPVLVEARERATITGGRSLDIVNSIVCHQDGTSVGPLRIANRTPRMVCHAGFPTDERLILTRGVCSLHPCWPGPRRV